MDKNIQHEPLDLSEILKEYKEAVALLDKCDDDIVLRKLEAIKTKLLQEKERLNTILYPGGRR